ncbi:hypothetical protein EDB80DRAFT_303942 [Ilyonectria destructans]|nr:hypothetical protein EDB80DRAFT_303942 [Ilyonectria destructans]
MAAIVRASSSSGTVTLCCRGGRPRVFRRSRTSKVRRTSSGETLTGSWRAPFRMRWLSRSSSVRRISSIGALIGSWRGIVEVVVERSAQRRWEGQTQRPKERKRCGHGWYQEGPDEGRLEMILTQVTSPVARNLGGPVSEPTAASRRPSKGGVYSHGGFLAGLPGTYEKQNSRRCGGPGRSGTFPTSPWPVLGGKEIWGAVHLAA